jgi:two-component system chemotaxis sensor kinase CheA
VDTSEYKQLFLSEAKETLNALNNLLVDLEKNPKDSGLLNELFRLSHTMKSMAQTMEYEDIARLTHSIEDTFTLLKSGDLKVKTETIDLLFKSLDTLNDLVEEVRKGELNDADVTPLIERFESLSSGIQKKGRNRKEIKRQEIKNSHIKNNETKKTEEILSPSDSQTVRVPLNKIDSIVDTAGELVINRIQLSQIVKTSGNSELVEIVDEISRLTSRLQDQVLQIRLVPLEYIFAPYPRLVRDTAKDSKKEIDFFIEGSNIGMDRSIQDEINEPLLHLLKNAVVHGIESPKEREKHKKAVRGTIRLTAKRERDFVVIELSDDGCGMNSNEIKKVALERGIITKDELQSLSPDEIVMLTTSPGFSRIKEVTESAGRGMGLNASKTKIEALGGTFSIESTLYKGTKFIIRLPLSMAIVKSMLVDVEDETFCIPLSYVIEMIKVAAKEIRSVDSKEIISYRETVLPLIRLHKIFGFRNEKAQMLMNEEIDDRTREGNEFLSAIDHLPVVVVELGNRKAGLIVDGVLGQQEVVIKPLTGLMKAVKYASGATILSTGKAALIVDVSSLF